MYQVVFAELLAHSAAPAADAAELHLDPDWLKYAGSNAYAPDSPLLDPSFRVRFLHQVGYRKILRFYLRHPGRLVDRIERASRQAWSMRPYFGNYEKSPERPTRTLATRFSALEPHARAPGERTRSSGSRCCSEETSPPRSRPSAAPRRGAGCSGRA